MMPHLGELQSEYKDKGLTVIGYTSKDPNNTAEKVAEFVSKRGPKLGYTFAYGDDQKTYQAWMTAADQHGIPCSFVVDQHGKLAYIGHPMFLGEVLPKVIAGTWKAEQGAAEVAELEKDVNDMFAKLQNSDASAALKDLAEFQTRRPGLAKIPFFEGPKISLLIKNKQFDEAKKAIDSILEKAIARDDAGALATIARSLQGPEVKENKEFAERLLKAADAMLKISGDKDLGALLTVADAYFSLGDKAKARTYAKRAVDAAPDDIRSKVETYVKKYDEKKDDTKKEVKE
jgi:tetratricopeptide (TPR) repeat protein